MITVTSRERAWQVADEYFPTDYMKDDLLSERAGYPIYKSTLEGCNSWISDLNTRLELNIEEDDGQLIKTITINITEAPAVEETANWSAYEVMRMCIAHDWYTAGTTREYDKMLAFVEENKPTPQNIYKVAHDILEHSDDDGQYVEAVMFTINKEAVSRHYKINWF